MGKFLGIMLVLVGGILLLKVVASFSVLLLLLAAGFALAAASGVIGKWGFTAAVACALLAIPLFMVKTMFFGLAMLFRLAPLLLVVFGIYVLVKAFR